MAYKISEIKEMTSEQLISELVYNAVRIAHNNGSATKAQNQTEKRIVKELSERLNLDETKLLDLLSK